MANHIPELEPHCGSWIVTRKDSGEVVGEFFKADRQFVERFNPDKVTIETAAEYLGRINLEIARESRKQNHKS